MSGGRWSAGQFLYLFNVLEMIPSRWRYTEDIKIIPHILCSTYNFIEARPGQAENKTLKLVSTAANPRTVVSNIFKVDFM